jgi:uncharacterized membrane protein
MMRTLSAGRISITTGVLVLAGSITAAGAAAEAAQDSTASATYAGKDVYGIVNLAGPFAFIADINARGQAAFEYFGPDRNVRVGFFNGERVIDITPPTSGTALLGDLNDKGEVAFASTAVGPGTNPFRPFRWSQAGGLVPLAALGEGNTFLTAINNRSEIVGRSALLFTDGNYRAARWSATNTLRPLGLPTGFTQSFASDINDYNVSVGFGDRADGTGRVLRWDAAGKPTDLGGFGTSYAFATHINNRGDIAGMLDTLSPNISAFLLTPGKSVLRVGTRSVIHQFNEIGELVGRRYGPELLYPKAWVFSRARGFVNLHPASQIASEANDINDSSVVVGLAQRDALTQAHAYRWTRSGGAVDLNTRLLNPPKGLVVSAALGVSNNGDIIADSNAGLVILRANGGGTDAPVLGPFVRAAPRLNQPFELTVSIRDRNVGESHTATVDWGDGSGPVPVSVSEYKGKGSLRGIHTYTSEGDFVIVVRVRDSGGRVTQLYENITIRELGTPTATATGRPAADAALGAPLSGPMAILPPRVQRLVR